MRSRAAVALAVEQGGQIFPQGYETNSESKYFPHLLDPKILPLE